MKKLLFTILMILPFVGIGQIQTNEFKISSSDQQKRALIAVGMDPERLKDITGTLEESANFYKDYNKNLKEDIELRLKNANPQFKKDENTIIPAKQPTIIR